MKFKILIFIITYKASYRVVDLIKKIPISYLKKHNFEIFISDDCSKDDTIGHINKIKRDFKKKLTININKSNLGYGGNIKKCIKHAFKKKIDYAVMLHGDNQYNPKYIKSMIQMLIKDQSIAAVSGSRMSKKTNAIKGKMPIYKFIGNIFLTKFYNLIYKTDFTDCHTGYWAYNLKKINKSFFMKADNDFCFDIDMRLLINNKYLTIKELPIETYYGNERSSMHIIYALRFFYKIFKYKLLRTL
ncbi:glycosyltransferase family 2 protein [Candidatus Pelagibacter sp.]|nr:glycosyltransferase family 2 protein [Candidatus Pelagibacter sp.]